MLFLDGSLTQVTCCFFHDQIFTVACLEIHEYFLNKTCVLFSSPPSAADSMLQGAPLKEDPINPRGSLVDKWLSYHSSRLEYKIGPSALSQTLNLSLTTRPT
ncbi:hypothetical protein PGT21_017209 [Puccinia graminis f. sp. tritici]|uniref:Uncharacterized protein n=1 Tax=Puccinia graminis f. sp. tritici TaxID=56615 RepID=A0A5B0NVQ1_PUCGR|nr:hypothetical protein PGT21_017209 [Puccinia graminis f. sp. tritici]KAA1115782.1 hypothetical protein PGTUg99_031734 [Puccinia graminis f. sp. tritici]